MGQRSHPTATRARSYAASSSEHGQLPEWGSPRDIHWCTSSRNDRFRKSDRPGTADLSGKDSGALPAAFAEQWGARSVDWQEVDDWTAPVTNMLMRIANKQTKRADLMASPPKNGDWLEKGEPARLCNKGGYWISERTNCTPAQLPHANEAHQGGTMAPGHCFSSYF